MVCKTVAERFGRGRETTNKHRVVLAFACILEVGAVAGFTFALLHLTLATWQPNSPSLLGGGSSSTPDPSAPPFDVVALVALPVIAVFAGAIPGIVEGNSTANRLAILGVSILLCFGAGIVYLPLLFMAATLAARVVEDSVTSVFLGIMLLLPALPFIVVPVLVDRWTQARSQQQ